MSFPGVPLGPNPQFPASQSSRFPTVTGWSPYPGGPYYPFDPLSLGNYSSPPPTLQFPGVPLGPNSQFPASQSSRFPTITGWSPYPGGQYQQFDPQSYMPQYSTSSFNGSMPHMSVSQLYEAIAPQYGNSYNDMVRNAISMQRPDLVRYIVDRAPANYNWDWQHLAEFALVNDENDQNRIFQLIHSLAPRNYNWFWDPIIQYAGPSLKRRVASLAGPRYERELMLKQQLFG